MSQQQMRNMKEQIQSLKKQVEEKTKQVEEKTKQDEEQRLSKAQDTYDMQQKVEQFQGLVKQIREKDDDNISTDDQNDYVQRLSAVISDPQSVPTIKAFMRITGQGHKWTITSIYCLAKLGLKYPGGIAYVKELFQSAKEAIQYCLDYIWSQIKAGAKWACSKIRQAYEWLKSWF